MPATPVTQQDLAIYRSQIHANQHWYTTVMEDEWWVTHAAPFYEKYYYAQRPRIMRGDSGNQPDYTLANTLIQDFSDRYVVTVASDVDILVRKTVGIGPGGYPAIQPGLLCTEDMVLWPHNDPCRHIAAIQQTINPTDHAGVSTPWTPRT